MFTVNTEPVNCSAKLGEIGKRFYV